MNIIRSSAALGAALRRIRKARGLTQAALGERAGLRQATISKLEDGAPGTEIATIVSVLAALDLELVVQDRTRGESIAVEELY